MASNEPMPEKAPHPAAESIAEAHKLLQTLQAELGRHPALDEAITKLEIALSALTIQTGGLL